MRSLRQDTVYALRGFSARPGFTVVAVLTLALGIGAATAIFSAVDAVLLRPLSFKDQDRLVTIWEKNLSTGTLAGTSSQNFIDWREKSDAFSEMAAFGTPNPPTLGLGDRVELVPAMAVTADFFRVAGVKPILGRPFTSEEALGTTYENSGRHRFGQRLAVISSSLWKSRFGADPGILDRSMTLDGNKWSITGVMPDGFRIPGAETDIWLPLDLSRPSDTDPVAREFRLFEVLARLKPGISLDQAQSNMETVARATAQLYPQAYQGWGVQVRSFFEEAVRDSKRPLLLLMGAVGLTLLIACSNVAGLLLARVSARRRELAVRSALGASSRRLVRQLLSESLILAGLGGLGGLALSYGGLPLLISLAPAGIPRLDQVAVDGRILVFALALTIATGIAFGLVPALQAVRSDPVGGIKEGGRSGALSGRKQVLRRGLVAAEVALAVLLLAGAGLLFKSFSRILSVDPGFDADGLLTFQLHLESSKYPPEKASRFLEKVVDDLRNLPGVVSAAAINRPPMRADTEFTRSCWRSDEPDPAANAVQAVGRLVTPGYFQTMGIPMLAGRDFGKQDRMGAPWVVIISRSLAEALWPAQNAVGRFLKAGRGGTDAQSFEVIAVVADTHFLGLKGTPSPELILAHTQVPYPAMNLVVRAQGDAARLVEPVRAAMSAADPTQPISGMTTMDRLIARWLAPDRFAAVLLGILALTALSLAATGIYASMSFLVRRRRHEMGIRMAVGARREDVQRMVLSESFRLAVAGCLVGLAAALALGKVMQGLLFQVSASDPTTLLLPLVVLIAVALLAAYLPARRAAKVDPLAILKCE